MRWIDNHCHFAGDEVADRSTIDEAAAVGVRRFIDVGCDLASSVAAIARSRAHPEVFATAGVHPHEAQHGIDGIEDLVGSGEVIAVGECGLDYHYDHSPRPVQRDVFAAQIALAQRHDATLVIHTREAWEETFQILDREGVPDRTIFHCFTGGADEAAECIDRGAYLSFSGIVTFKSAVDVQEAAVLCPADRLLVETDSPYLAPVPHRGKQNQPAWVVAVGERLAELRGCSVETIADSTWRNAHVAYPLGSEPVAPSDSNLT